MKNSTKITVVACVALASCSSVDGTYEPGCMAYAGDTIHLKDGHFRWDKFTDQVVIDSNRQVVDQFVDYPLLGTYKVDGNHLRLVTEAGELLPELFLIHDEGRTVLLNVKQHDAWQNSGEYPECALALDTSSDSR